MQDLSSKLKRMIERLQSAQEEAFIVRRPPEIGIGHVSLEEIALAEAEDRINHIVDTVQIVEEELQELLEETLESKGKTLH